MELPEWVPEEIVRAVRPRTEQILFGLGLLVALGLLYGVYSASLHTRDLRERRARFETALENYLRLRPGEGPAPSEEGLSNPLAYLGEKVRSSGVRDDRLMALTPSGEGPRGRPAYRIRFEGIPLRPAVVLLRELESEGRFGVREFTVARVGSQTSRYDVTLRLLGLGGS